MRCLNKAAMGKSRNSPNALFNKSHRDHSAFGGFAPPDENDHLLRRTVTIQSKAEEKLRGNSTPSTVTSNFDANAVMRGIAPLNISRIFKTTKPSRGQGTEKIRNLATHY
jgi:hypothetical protein